MLRYALFYLRALFGSLADPQVRPYLAAAVSLIALGTVVYTLVEGWDPFDAAYFSVVSLATVGYGDLAPVTRLGRLFTMIYVVAGLGVLGTFIGAVTRVSVDQAEKGRQQRLARRRKIADTLRTRGVAPTAEPEPKEDGPVKE